MINFEEKKSNLDVNQEISYLSHDECLQFIKNPSQNEIIENQSVVDITEKNDLLKPMHRFVNYLFEKIKTIFPKEKMKLCMIIQEQEKELNQMIFNELLRSDLNYLVLNSQVIICKQKIFFEDQQEMTQFLLKHKSLNLKYSASRKLMNI